MDNETLLQMASDYAENGQNKQARDAIIQAIKNNRLDVEAWWALANVTRNNTERERALKEVLKLEPGHLHAQHMHDQLRAGTLNIEGTNYKIVNGEETINVDFMPKVAVTLVAYFVIYFVGLILNLYFLHDANNFHKTHGFKPDNVGCLWAMLAFFLIFPVVACALVTGVVMIASTSVSY